MVVKDLKKYLEDVPDDFKVSVFDSRKVKLYPVSAIFHAEGYLDIEFSEEEIKK